jgi:hypothetical protein
MLQAVLDTLAACLLDGYNINKLKVFDVEYIFLQLRTKSVGESTKLTFKCTKCESDNEVIIPINEVKIEFIEDNINDVDIGGQYNLKLQYPEFYRVVNMERIKDETEAQLLFKTAGMCMHTLETEEEQIAFADETPQAIDEFIESLTSEQFNTIMEFTQNMPTIKHDGNFKCAKCQHDNEYKIKGIQDFF